MQNDKSPGNDHLTREFFAKVWIELKALNYISKTGYH